MKRGPTDTTSNCPELRGFLMYLAAERRLAVNTILSYRSELEGLDRHLVELKTTLTRASESQIKQYLRHRSSSGKRAGTIRHCITAIGCFLKFLSTLGIDRMAIAHSLDRPEKDHNLPRVLNRHQVLKLLAAPDPEGKMYLRDVAMLELLYASGVRASELSALTIVDCNLQSRWMRVKGKGSVERIVPFGVPAAGAVGSYIEKLRPRLKSAGSGDVLFLDKHGDALAAASLWFLIGDYAEQSGLPRCGPHMLRHCFATHLLNGGADLRVIQELLGHTNISTTQIYTHVDQARLKAVHSKYHAR